MSDSSLMDELRRLVEVDWIPNEISATLAILSELSEEQERTAKSAKVLIEEDGEAREIISKKFQSFSEKYTGPRDPQKQGYTFSTEDFLANDEALNFIQNNERVFKEIHDCLVELCENDNMGMGVRSLAVAESFVQKKVHLLMEACKESNEGKEPNNQDEQAELGAKVDQIFESRERRKL